MSDSEPGAKDPIIIKKYANRRLYNTQTSSYVTLDHLCEMVKEGVEFEVHDARTNEDITRQVLAQIIFEEENKGQHLLPIQFLRQLIGFYGNSLQTFIPSYLEMSMESFAKNQKELRDKFAEAAGGKLPFADIEQMTRQNVQMFENAMKMFAPFASQWTAGKDVPNPFAAFAAAAGMKAPGQQEAKKSEPKRDEELNDLKAQLAAMREEIANLARKK